MASELSELVARFRRHPALTSKAWLRLVSQTFGATNWATGPGDDAAVVDVDGRHLLVAGEAIHPPFVRSDPFNAGVAAVVANINDIAAMGGRALGLVDTVVASEDEARRALEGIRYASGLYRVPVVGGHLNVIESPASVSAFVIGRATRVLSANHVSPGQLLLAACCVRGTMRGDFPFWSSLGAQKESLADDIVILPSVAEAGDCVAAKDVSMAGLMGSVAMLLEPTRTGATVDLDRVPRPPGIPIGDWIFTFPSFGFLLCAPPSREQACRTAFTDRGISCEVVAEINATGKLDGRLGGECLTFLDLNQSGVTHLGDEQSPIEL